VLTPAAARRVGSLYSDAELDLTRLRPLRAKMVELGRACVHPDWRSGGAILALWGALAEFMHRKRLDTMSGCASVSMRDGGHFAASLWERLRQTHLAPIEWQVAARLPLPMAELQSHLRRWPRPLLPFAELVVDERDDRVHRRLLIGPGGFDLDGGADAGRQHHHAHDALGIHAPIVSRHEHIALKAAGQLGQLCRGTRMQAQLIDDGYSCLDHWRPA
jgi:hypothetical protein